MSERIRPAAVLACVLVALAAPASQSLMGWGLTASEFSDSGDSTLRVQGYAFSIWGLIYTGLILYAVRRLIQGRGGALEAATDAPLAGAALGCGLWIIAAGLNLRWLTVLVIAVSLAAAVSGLVRVRALGPRLTWPQRVVGLWPLSFLAGWLTAATVVNLVTVLTAEGLIPASAATPAALAGVGGAGVIAVTVLLSTRFASYAVPVAWGLVGAFVAERADKPVVAFAAVGCAGLLLAIAGLVALREQSSPRP